MADDFPFARDFGYLMPFLDRVGEASAALADPRARAEAMQLASEEKARWIRLRALLEGAPGAEAPATPRTDEGRAVDRERSGSEEAPPRSERPANPSPGWTVGTLRGRS